MLLPPVADGNARAARLVLDFELAREAIVLAEVGAIFRHPIPAGDAEAIRAFVRLAERLALASASRVAR